MPTLGSVKPLLYDANADQPPGMRAITPTFGSDSVYFSFPPVTSNPPKPATEGLRVAHTVV